MFLLMVTCNKTVIYFIFTEVIFIDVSLKTFLSHIKTHTYFLICYEYGDNYFFLQHNKLNGITHEHKHQQKLIKFSSF